MRKEINLAISICFLLNSFSHAQHEGRTEILFDDDWKFFRGGAQRAESAAFNDSSWRTVCLPHDWSIEDLPQTQSPFHPDAISQVSGGFTIGGTGWYRKSFFVPIEKKGKRIQIQFDGVYMNADVWVNGLHVGNHPYGYTGFYFDITDKIRFGENNTVAVEVKNEGQNSRWYSGSGIYRHVWLRTLDPVHIMHEGVYITTPEVNNDNAKVNILTKVNNTTEKPLEIKIVNKIFDSRGEQAGKIESWKNIEANSSLEYEQSLNVSGPQRWLVETPHLYSVVTEIFFGEYLLDSRESKFGIRTISFSAANGFQLNGETIKLKGGCVHHDNGPLGARAFDRAEARKIELLKASGFNAIRCSHNPPSTAFLDACDRLGMLVIDEAFDMWRQPSNPYDYHLYFDKWWQPDVESMVYRDRNHPCIIMWSIGNEIKEMENPEVIEVEKALGNYVKKLDPTRPVTAAVNNLRIQKDEFFSHLDVCGYNYAIGGGNGEGNNVYEADHKRVPQRIMFGSESFPMESFESWMQVVDHPYVIGDFTWTAFDYMGEASIGWRGYWQEKNFYPWNLAYCGDIDICGWRRPQSFYREVLWKPNMIALFVKSPTPAFPLNPDKQSWSKWEWPDLVADWNWNGMEGKAMEVVVYSSCGQVELFLNGKSLGKKLTDRSNKFTAHFVVPYQKGELKVIGYQGKKIAATSGLTTTGKATALKLSADVTKLIANNQDLAYVTVELVDSNGRSNSKADDRVNFSIEGPGEIIGVGNANPMSTESCQLPWRKTWRGKCLVIVKSLERAGNIVLTAKAEGVPATVLTLQVVKQQ